MLEAAVLTVLPGAVAFAAAMDLLTMKIPNRIPAVMVLAFFPLALVAGFNAWDMANHVAAGLLMLVLGVLLFMPGWFGGGDAKLMAAIGLWIGVDNLRPICSESALAGGLIAVAFILGALGPAAALAAGRSLGAQAAPARHRHSLRPCAGGGRTARLSADDLVRHLAR